MWRQDVWLVRRNKLELLVVNITLALVCSLSQGQIWPRCTKGSQQMNLTFGPATQSGSESLDGLHLDDSIKIFLNKS